MTGKKESLEFLTILSFLTILCISCPKIF